MFTFKVFDKRGETLGEYDKAGPAYQLAEQYADAYVRTLENSEIKAPPLRDTSLRFSLLELD